MNYKLILASASPRRKQLLRDAGFEFELRLKEVVETYPEDMVCEEVPKYLSCLKAAALKSTLKKDELLITADTVVILDDMIIGKPVDRDDAIRMLTALSGRRHEVVTGVCLTTIEQQEIFGVSTYVYFAELNREDIIYYVDNYKPFDKAGAYGIQEWIGFIGIERIEGSFYNVMGLPIQTIARKLKEFK
ncbi:MAG: Maf family nucleotide pyrophosphatase [Culturomica sp.]|jgi:septum formation protein|nr:Maf family nucleotide pyrophosphatase [Culturomica sp.]